MRLAPLRRPNHYQGIQIDHRPNHISSPYGNLYLRENSSKTLLKP